MAGLRSYRLFKLPQFSFSIKQAEWGKTNCLEHQLTLLLLSILPLLNQILIKNRLRKKDWQVLIEATSQYIVIEDKYEIFVNKKPRRLKWQKIHKHY